MAVDMPAFGQALWSGFVAGKLPRPEYLIPVLYSESGLNPAITNSIGCVGIDQLAHSRGPSLRATRRGRRASSSPVP